MRRIAYAALMIAVGLTGAYAETIPNFELLTITAFASGVLLGVRDGSGVAALMTFLFSVLNPYGIAHPVVTAAQVLGEVLAAAAGGLSSGLAHGPAAVRAVALGAIGAVLTLVYDLATNVASGIVYGQMLATLVLGIRFALWHIATNTALFAAVGPVLVTALAPYRARLSSSR